MVVVSAVALCSSTYAWFAANNKVTAEGMQVQATAEGGIEIAYVDDSTSVEDQDYSTIASANMSDATALYPTSTMAGNEDGNNIIVSPWYHVIAATSYASTAKEGTYEELSFDENSKGAIGEKTTM